MSHSNRVARTGRTPPCTQAIIAAGIGRVVVGAIDPNPRHQGRGLALLRRAGIRVESGVLARECTALNEAFNHWIIYRRPLVTVKAAMTLDGKIATACGESKWITGESARAYGMKLRAGADAILVGINTVLADDPELTVRGGETEDGGQRTEDGGRKADRLRRIVLDALARTPLDARVLRQDTAALTTIVVSRKASRTRTRQLSQRARVLVAPSRDGLIDLEWLLSRLGREEVTSLLVEGGGEVNASFLLSGLAHRVAFFYAPKILGGAKARKAVAGLGATTLAQAVELTDARWRKLGKDLLLLARTQPKGRARKKE